MKLFRLQLARWGQGLFKACVTGGAMAAQAMIGTNALAPVIKLPELAMSLKEMGLVFLSGAGYALWKYLVANPLPELELPETRDPNPPR